MLRTAVQVHAVVETEEGVDPSNSRDECLGANLANPFVIAAETRCGGERRRPVRVQ